MLFGLGAFYTLAFLLVIVSLDEVAKVRWWLVLIGALIILGFSWMALRLLRKDTQWEFAKKHYDAQNVDLPPRSRSKSISEPVEAVPQEKDSPELGWAA